MRWLLSCLLLLTTLSAEESGEFSLVNLTKSPIPRTAGTVNVITGHFVDQAVHLSTSGPDPYILAHSYTSSSLEEGTISDGWDYFHPSDLIIYQPQGISYKPKALTLEAPQATEIVAYGHDARNERIEDLYFNYASLLYRESGGASVLFRGSQHAKHFKPKLQKTGYSLISSTDSPCRCDIKQTTITHNDHSDEWIVTLIDGTKRTYTPTKRLRHQPCSFEENNFKRAYQIKEERLPSGNYRNYSYHTDHTLKAIETLSSDKKHTLHTISFKKDHHHIDIDTSDGLSTAISLKKLHDKNDAHIVAKITRPSKPDLSYSYSEQSKQHLRRIDKRFTSNGRTDLVKFYKEGKNDVNGTTVEVNHHFHVNRVRELWTHASAGKQPHISHAFFYSDGKATVVEDDGGSSSYHWDAEKRLTSFSRKSPKGKLLCTEQYTWDDGRLTSRTITDNNNHPVLIRSFHYDHDSDVTKESLRGRFSHHTVHPLSLDNHDHLHGGEEFTWKATYDDRHLKTGECDPLDNWTFYEYESHRDLLTARFTCSGEHIIRREFFEYDASATCTEEILDDGSSRHKEHMAHVTRRTIHTISPRKKTPYYGAPEEERWYTWTADTGKQLIKKELFHRNHKGLVTKKELFDTAGTLQKTWHYAYDDLHRLIESVDPTGRTERYTYDSSGRLSSKQTPESTISYKYDLFDRPIIEKNTYPDGSTSSLCRTYSRSGRVVNEIDGRGRSTTTYRDMTGRIKKKILPTIATDSGTKSPKETYTYTNTTERHTSPTGAITEILRSATGKPLVTTNPFGAKTYYRYDARNRLIEQVDPSGLTTTFSYDAFDRVTKTTKIFNKSTLTTTNRYVGFDLVEESQPTKRISYTYDAFGRKTSETLIDLVTNESITIKTVYDTLHRPVRLINKALKTEELTAYDRADRVLEHKIIGADGSLLAITIKAYDLAGRTIEEGVGRAGTIAKTSTTYGAYGLPSSITMPDGTKTVFSYKPLYQHSDGLSYFKKTTTDAKGVTTEELLDANDQPHLIITKDPYGTLLAKRKVFVSILGKPVLIEEYAITNGSATSTIKTRLDYDSAGRLTACIQALGTPEQATWKYAYDPMGRKIEEKKPSGTVLFSSYDSKSRLKSYRSSDKSVALTYRYNSQDLPEKVKNETTNRTTYRTYDGLGHMLSETLETGLCLKADVRATGLCSSITYPDGSKTTYSYRYGQLHRIQRNGYAYEVLARDTSGLITRAMLPCASELSQSLDVMGRRTSVNHALFSEKRTLFDAVGCLLERTVDGKHESFSYDLLHQLTSDNGRSAAYDSLHRRLESNGKTAVHNAHHQVLSHGSMKVKYDSDGRRLTDGRFHFSYDALDRLIAVDGGTGHIEYQYDGFNRRILAKGSALTEERYLWHGDYEIGAMDGQGKPLSLRVLGEGLGGEIGAAIAVEIKGTLYVPVHDLSGHVRVLLNQNGSVAEKLTYTAFGVESRTAALTPWTFSSKREDPLTGFFYFGRRVYDPSTATWLTQDPLGYTAGPNLYAYVKNNPLMLVDVMGLLESGGGFWSSMWDGFCGMFGGGGESSAPSAPSYHQTQHEPTGTREVLSSNGNAVRQKNSPPEWDHVLIYPQGSIAEFVKEFQGQALGNAVACLIGGMLTRLDNDLERAEKIMGGKYGYMSVFILHNATKGFLADFGESAANAHGRGLRVGRVLLEQFEECLDACIANQIAFSIDFYAHSQGAAILYNILVLIPRSPYHPIFRDQPKPKEIFQPRFLSILAPCLQ